MTRRTCRWVQSTLTCSRWTEVSDGDRAAVVAHLASCPSCREFEKLSRTLNGLLPRLEVSPPSPFVERRMVHAALENRGDRGRSPLSPRFRPAALAGAVVLAAAAVLATTVILQDDAEGTGGRVSSSMPSPPTLHVTTPSPTPKASPSLPDRSGVGNRVTFDGAAPLVLPGSRIWGTQSASISFVEQGETCHRIRLIQGKIVAKVQRIRSTCRFVVETSNARVEVKGTIFSVEILPGGAEQVRVLEGAVVVTDLSTGGQAQQVTARRQVLVGQSRTTAASSADIRSDARFLKGELTGVEWDDSENRRAGVRPGERRPSNKQPEKSRDLLQRAKEHRQRHQYEEARERYLELISRYPESSAAANAMVALAQMEIGVLKDAAAALTHFSKYIERHPSGTLVDEAWIGRVRALIRLKKYPAALDAATRYLRTRSRGSVTPEVLRRRGDIHGKLRNCRAALEDYNKVLERWPTTREAKHARDGIARCSDSL